LGEPETHPEDMIHVNGKAFEVHNMYAHEWAKMLYEGYKENYPERRLFHLNRSGATGTQRYSIFPWSGDVSRSWSGLQAQLPLMLNMSLCGLGYISSDLGGFALGKKDEELYIRWLQMGVFNPIFRPHGSGIPSEPIFFSEQTQSIVRKAIKLRYRLMPYIYNLAFRNSLEGEPLVKPLIYYHPKEKFEDYSDSYYFGNQLLVSPVIEKGQTQKKINLPNGLWYDFYTDTVYEGGKQIIYNCDLSYIPVLVKAGAFIPMLFDYQTTDSYPDSLITMHYYPSDLGSESVYELFEDDGAYSKSVDNGEFSITNFYSQK
jgi:oligosaccharide 4-alpha-D-glucosyltransferase